MTVADTCARCGHEHRSSLGDPYCVGPDYTCTCPAYVAPTDEAAPTIDRDALRAMATDQHYVANPLSDAVFDLLDALDAETRRADAAERNEARAVSKARPLVAERDALAERLAAEESAHGVTIAQRDAAETAADRLAYAIAPVAVIGEHSSMNDPWANAEVEAERLALAECYIRRALGDESTKETP